MKHKITRTVSRDKVRVVNKKTMTLSTQHGFTSPITDKRVYIDMKIEYNDENASSKYNKWRFKSTTNLDSKTETGYSYDHIHEFKEYGGDFAELNRNV